MIIIKTDLIEIPECCELCPYSKRYGLVGDRFCTVTQEYFTGNITPPYKERPDECPLRKIDDPNEVSKRLYSLDPFHRNELEKAMLGRGIDYDTIQLIINDFENRLKHLYSVIYPKDKE